MNGFNSINNNQSPKKISNTEKKLLKENLIAKAINFHSQGNLPEAIKYYDQFLSQGYTDVGVFNNYAVILSQLRRYDLAKKLYLKTINIYPNDPDAYSNLGLLLKNTNNLIDAEGYLLKAIELNPNFFDAYFNLGIIYIQLERFEKAEVYILKAIQLNSNNAQLYCNLAGIQINLRKLSEADKSLRKAIELDPKFPQTYLNLAMLSKQIGNPLNAEKYLRIAIELKPDFTQAYNNLGSILNDLSRYHEAKEYLLKAIQLDPQYSDAYCNLGIIFKELGEFKAAKESTLKAIKLNPKFFTAYSNLSIILKELGEINKAKIFALKAIDLNPNISDSHSNLGIILKELCEIELAEKSFRRAIEINPNFFQAYSNLGIILQERKKYKEAEFFIRKAIQLKPNFAEAYNNLGVLFKHQRKLSLAADSFSKAIELNPKYAESYSNLGGVLLDQGELKLAKTTILKALELNNNLADAHFNLGTIFRENKDFELASKAFKNVLEIDNYNYKAVIELISSFSMLSDWNQVEKYLSHLNRLNLTDMAIDPFKLLHIEDNPSSQLIRAKNFYTEHYKRQSIPIKYDKKKKIHVGYFSADFCLHPISVCMTNVFELHDKSKFEIFFYSFGTKDDEYTQRIKDTGFIFRDIKSFSDLEAVKLAREDQLDIAIDLMQFTKNNRMSLFSYRVAPIQINYLGLTTGSSEINYYIADKVSVPEDSKKYFSEKIIYLPNSFMPFDRTRNIPTNTFSRKQFNLSDDSFVLAAFHKNKKITLKEINSWSNVLNKVSHAVLWIQRANKISEGNLIDEFVARGIERKRIIFAEKMPTIDEHLARHLCADLFVDTFCFNAHSTSLDSLWAGLPIVTLQGKSFAARVSSSFLTTLKMTELIAKSPEEYEEIIINLAKDPIALIQLKDRLLKSRDSNPLFDSKLSTLSLENIYHQLVKEL